MEDKIKIATKSTDTCVVNSINGIYARTSKDYSDNVHVTLQHGDTVEVLDKDNEWATILYKDKTLYVCSAYLV